MKILHVIPCFYPEWSYGGPVRVAYDITKELVKNGHEVTVYTSDCNPCGSKTGVRTAEVDGIHVYYFKNFSKTISRKLKMYVTPHMVSYLKHQIRNFDVVHFHEYRTFQNIFAYYYARKFSVPYVIQVHGSLLSNGTKQKLKFMYDKMLGLKFLRNVAKVIAISEAEAKQYRFLGVPEQKIIIIPNSLDISETMLPSKGHFKEKFSIDEEEKIILYLGRVHELKGIDFIINAFVKLISNGKKNLRLVIAGSDDGYLNVAKDLVTSLGCSSYTLFSGALSETDKQFAYTDSSVVVYPERHNVFGMVPLEAAAYKRPVIVSKENYMSKVVGAGDFGFSVKYGDVDSLTKMLELAVTNEALMDYLGTRGRQFIIDNFSLKGAVKNLEKLYVSAIPN